MVQRLTICLLFSLLFVNAAAQPFSCNGQFYVVTSTNGKSNLYEMWLDDSGKINRNTIALSQPDRQYTCLGLSIEDLYLYALDFNTKELLKIDSRGLVTNLGIPANLDVNLEYWAGEVAPEGRRLVVFGRDKATGRDKSVYTINLTRSDYYAGSAGVVSNVPTALTDISTDPIRGITYGYDKNNKQLVVIATNAITHHNHKAITPFFESLFFDRAGNLYGYGAKDSDKEQSMLFALDKIKGEAVSIGSAMSGEFGDGCSCSQTLTFTRKIEPQVLLPCSEFTIEYRIVNHSGVGKTGSLFSDLLPPEFIITGLEDHTFTLASVESGVGSNKLIISNLDILIGENIIKIRGRLEDTFEEKYFTQAFLNGLPKGLGNPLNSDNPSTSIPQDANISIVLQENSLELENFMQFNCSGDTATLGFPFKMDEVLWSTGDTGAVLFVTEPGLYWAEAANSCVSFKDSVLVNAFPEPLWVDAGLDLEVFEGSKVSLSAKTNVPKPFELVWEGGNAVSFSCQNCLDPELIALEDQTICAKIEVPGKCILKDSLSIKIIPYRSIFGASAFSPNGNGINEQFYIQGTLNVEKIKEMRVFDRWGNIVFERLEGQINVPEHGWDGKVKGQKAPAGTYIWTATIVYINGDSERITGTVNLF